MSLPAAATCLYICPSPYRPPVHASLTPALVAVYPPSTFLHPTAHAVSFGPDCSRSFPTYASFAIPRAH